MLSHVPPEKHLDVLIKTVLVIIAMKPFEIKRKHFNNGHLKVTIYNYSHTENIFRFSLGHYQGSCKQIGNYQG